MKICFITAIYGGYDHLAEQTHLDKNDIDWYCFTDQPLNSSTWNIITTPYHLQDTTEGKNAFIFNYHDATMKTYHMMCAKYYKAQSHRIDILAPYDYIVWMDARMLIKHDFIPFLMEQIQQGHKLIHFQHYMNTCVEAEVYLSLIQERYVQQNVVGQFAFYKQQGFPDQTGLYEMTIFIRNMRDATINATFDLWWKHNICYSFQDQISYPFVLWKMNILPDFVIRDGIVWDSKYTGVMYINHLK